jgi:hypothetical protein
VNPPTPETNLQRASTSDKQTKDPVLKARRETIALPPAIAERLGQGKWPRIDAQPIIKHSGRGSKRP